MTKHTQLQQALNELKKITGISLEISAETEEEETAALQQIRCLCHAYKEKYDKTYFLLNILQGKMGEAEIGRQAARFHIPMEEQRMIFLLEARGRMEQSSIDILKNMFPSGKIEGMISVSDRSVVLLYRIDDLKVWQEEAGRVAHMIYDTLSAEAFLSVKVSCGLPFTSLGEGTKAYRQAGMAMKIGGLFNEERRIFYYDQLGVDRLVYHLPEAVRSEFLREVWKEQIPDELDEELYATLHCFLQNNLNIAETARRLHMHRNTLIYRIEKIQAMTDLDIRCFEDAMTFKLALMIMDYNRKKEGDESDAGCIL